MMNKEQIEEIIAEANDEIKKFGRTSQKVSKNMINALVQLKNCNIQNVSGSFTADDVERAYDDGYQTEGEVNFDIENYR